MDGGYLERQSRLVVLKERITSFHYPRYFVWAPRGTTDRIRDINIISFFINMVRKTVK